MKGNFKENRECWLLEEFCKALNKKNSQIITFECGEDNYSHGDGRLVINNEKIPVEIVTAEGPLYTRIALSKKNKKLPAFEIKAVGWIKNALKLKVDKYYSNEEKLTILIEYGWLGSINKEYLLRELKKDEEMVNFVKRFKDIFILSPSTNSDYIEKSRDEPILVKIDKI